MNPVGSERRLPRLVEGQEAEAKARIKALSVLANYACLNYRNCKASFWVYQCKSLSFGPKLAQQNSTAFSVLPLR